MRFLVELSRLGSMRAVAAETGHTTSTVSQQIAVLSREAGARLIEPEGRGIRLTPAGRRLADHGVGILAAVDAARADLDAGAEPAGAVRIAGFATAVRRSLLPIAAELAAAHPKVQLLIREHEPGEAFELLAADDVDLALVYDYNLAPVSFDPILEPTPLWSVNWGLGVPADTPGDAEGDAPATFARFRDRAWIANSRGSADEQVLRILGSMAGFEPEVPHRVDSLDLVQDLIVAGLGVALLPADQATLPEVRVLALGDPGVILRCYAVTRRGRAAWPPLALVVRMLTASAATGDWAP